jgi:transcriptional regulator with XRE-family HTH domain
MTKEPTSRNAAKAPPAPTVLDAHFGQRLRLRRELLDVDRRSIGRIVGLTAADIGRLEEGHKAFDVTLVYRLCQALEVPVYWFFDGLGVVEQTLLSTSPQNAVRGGQHAAEQIGRAQRGEALITYFEVLDNERQALVVDLARLLTLRDVLSAHLTAP